MARTDVQSRRFLARTLGGGPSAAAVILLLAACGKSGAPDSGAVPDTPPPTRGGTPGEPATATEIGGAPVLHQPWTGDFDGMVERRCFRVLVVPSKTYYFVEEGQPRGTAYEIVQGLRGRAQQEARPAPRQGPRGLRSHHSRRPDPGAARGPRRRGRRRAHDHARPARAGRLHRPDLEGRARDRRHRSALAADRDPRRPLRPGDLRPQVVLVLGAPRRAEPEASPPRASRRRSWRRRPRSSRTRTCSRC